MLYKTRLLSDEHVFVCPTIERNSGGEWFNPENPWPVNNTRHTQMTYGTRRMKNYDDSRLAYEQDHQDSKDDHVMIWSAGVAGIPRPADFSFMADTFRMPSMALKSHVPGVNVLYLDGHVAFWRDGSGKVLYDNGLPHDRWSPEFNWPHDDIWMIIDGYHRPPVGSGNR